MNWTNVAPTVVPIVLSVLGTALVWVAVHAGGYLKSKMTSTAMVWAYDLLSATASSLAAHVKSELAPALTSMLSDGSISAADFALLQTALVKVLKETLTDQLGAIKKGLGISDDGALNTIISGIATKVLAATTTVQQPFSSSADPVAAKIGQAAAALTAAAPAASAPTLATAPKVP